MINVCTTYGVMGDGGDDAPALQNAVDNESWLYIPNGTYQLNAMTRMKASQRLTLAPGARLVRGGTEPLITNTPAGGGAGGYSGYGDITIEGGIFDANGTTQTEYSAAIAIAHGTNITIRDIRVLNVPGWHALEINGCKTVHIERCRFQGFRHTGDRGFSEAIQVDAMTSSAAYPWGGPYDGTVCEDVEVSRCWFGASSTPGTQAWPRAVGSHNSSEPNRHRNIRVTRNTCQDLTDAAIQTYFWDGGLIAHNTIYSPGGEGIAIKDDSRYVLVHGNQVTDAGRTGMWVNTDCTRIALRSNEIIGSGQSVNNSHFGIRVSKNCSWVKVVGNSVSKRASGNSAKYGLSLASDCSNCQRYGNELRSSGVTGSIEDLSTSGWTSADDSL